mmetsp:Transcript_12775/g.26075  ORF Transcript_12775/g.26075 Transcript_12775/m.26075 type:complete len:365 (-) Transcript_12775:2662-3756(-)
MVVAVLDDAPDVAKVRHAAARRRRLQDQDPTEAREQLRGWLVDRAYDGEPPAPGEVCHSVDHRHRRDAVQPRGRLVEEEDGGVRNDLHGDRGLLTELGRDPAGLDVADQPVARMPDAYGLHRVLRLGEGLVVRDAEAQLRGEVDRLEHGRPLHVRVELLHVAGDAWEEASVEALAVDEPRAGDPPAGFLTGDDVEKRRLARSTRAHERHHVAGARVTFDRIQQGDLLARALPIGHLVAQLAPLDEAHGALLRLVVLRAHPVVAGVRGIGDEVELGGLLLVAELMRLEDERHERESVVDKEEAEQVQDALNDLALAVVFHIVASEVHAAGGERTSLGPTIAVGRGHVEERVGGGRLKLGVVTLEP